MSTTKPDNPPAFPHTKVYNDSTEIAGGVRNESGMTLRDWFAGQAKISSHLVQEVLRANGENPSNVTLTRLFEVRADLKYKEADAMLTARAPRPA